MDSRLEKALAFSNYNKTLNLKRTTLKEKSDAKLVLAYKGGIFKAERSLIVFAQMLIDQGRADNIPLLDINDNPILVEDLNEFKNLLLDKYFDVTLEYYREYQKIKRSRSVETLIDL
jgi:hypothetical protein